MKVLITGGGGFLGIRLATALLARGELSASDGSMQPIDDITLFDQTFPEQKPIQIGERLSTVTGDISNGATVRALGSYGERSESQAGLCSDRCHSLGESLGVCPWFCGEQRWEPRLLRAGSSDRDAEYVRPAHRPGIDRRVTTCAGANPDLWLRRESSGGDPERC